MAIATIKSEEWKYIGFNDTWFTIIGIPLVSLCITILFFNEANDTWVMFFERTIGSLPFTIMFWMGVRYAMLWLRKRYDGLEYVMKRLTILILVILLVAPIASIIMNEIIQYFVDLLNFKRVPRSANEEKVIPVYFICFFMVAVYEAIYFYYQLKESIVEKEQAKQAQIRSELAGLRNQVNPHFLFNSMNTLMNIVIEDQQLAVNFLKKLSKVYRYVLENREEQIIPLSKELDFIHSYVFLQKERFKGSLEVDIKISDEHLTQRIIPLSLQILFENAIKHNVISRKKPLLIEVFITHGKLVVRNNLQRKEQVMDSTKVGLENIKTRYRFFTEEVVDIKEDEQYFSVGIPLLIF